MRKISGLSLMAILATASCTHMKGNDYVATTDMTPETAREWTKPFEFEPAKRHPSQIVNRPTYHWEADTLKIVVGAGSVINNNYKVKFTHFSEYVSREEVVRDVPTEVIDHWEARNDAVLVCDANEGAGQSSYWNAFYSAPAKDKAAALDNAVQGIGVATAKKLIANGYFHQKPRSWSDFEAEIRSAEKAGLMEQINVYQVLYKFRQENMTKLGYNTQMTGVCHMAVGDTYYAPIYVLRNVRKVVVEDVAHKDVIATEVRDYPIQVAGQKLQSFEQDTLVFSFDHDSNNVSLSPAYYNNYALSFQGGALHVAGTGRKAVQLPDDVILPGAILEGSGGMARFSAAFNQKYIPKSAADGQLLVSIRVTSCKQNSVFRSMCALSRDEQSQPVVVKQVGNGPVTHTFQRVSGRNYWVHYWVNTSNSPWYARNVVSTYHDPTLH